ncbi:MAG: hypothetical protein KC445_20350 [Anaerolineales bacterium]|nr:hypothetical protein [Anaerolineales bacterium]
MESERPFLRLRRPFSGQPMGDALGEMVARVTRVSPQRIAPTVGNWYFEVLGERPFLPNSC